MQRDASVQTLALGLGLLLLVAAPQPTQAGRKPSIDPVLCGDTDLSGLSVVNVTAGVGQVRLLAEAPEACKDAQDPNQCETDWGTNEARRAGRQLGRIVAKINEQLQKEEVSKYDKLKRAAEDAAANDTNSTTNSTEPYDVLEEPPAELNLTESETAAWKAAAGKFKAKRDKGKPNPKGKRDEDGFMQQLEYVCHTTEGRTVTLYMRIAQCTKDSPCDDFDEVE